MKTNHLKLVGVLFMIFAPVIIYFSCKKQSKSDENSTSTFVTINAKRYNCVNLHYVNRKNTNSHLLTSGSPSCLAQENFLNSNMTSGDIATLFTSIKSSFVGDILSNSSIPSTIVLYTNDSPLTTISFSDVKAISIFSYSGSGVYTHYYYTVGVGLNTTAVSAFNKTGTYYYMDDLNSLCNIAGVNGFAKYTHVPGITPSVATSNGLGARLLDTLMCMAIGANGNTGGGYGCSNCDEPEDGTCIDDPDEGTVCQSALCGATYENSYGLSNSLITTSDTLNISIGEGFKNSFLTTYTKGQQYIVYYHQISYVENLLQTINSSNFASHFTLSQELYTCANVLQYGASSDIPITSTLHTNVTNMINYYKTVTKNPQFQDILNQIQSDFDTYNGMTKSSILGSL